MPAGMRMLVTLIAAAAGRRQSSWRARARGERYLTMLLGGQAGRAQREPSQGFRPTFRGRKEEREGKRLDLVKIEGRRGEEKGKEEGREEVGWRRVVE